MGNQETLDRFFPAMFAQDAAALRTMFSPDIVWHAPPFAALKYGALVGADAVVSFLTGAGDEYYEPGSFSFEREVESSESDRSIVIGIMRATTASGGPYENRYAFGFRFADDLIIEAWELLDSIHFENQMGSG